MGPWSLHWASPFHSWDFQTADSEVTRNLKSKWTQSSLKVAVDLNSDFILFCTGEGIKCGPTTPEEPTTFWHDDPENMALDKIEMGDGITAELANDMRFFVRKIRGYLGSLFLILVAPEIKSKY
ncbi:hypothetical protein TCE0_060f19091 [Talaromyces pinophilus]|uniref:Uncharacterized protein n=1 Tax=Talaromyces pinophilus TaxID=128442 RepID=A0A6V8HTN7_TALPI|nr:hypothetical protein TCE0_060f19091 [Talaromyces pinophilus]